jgi:aerobic C4-dicarboxylate transport protein
MRASSDTLAAKKPIHLSLTFQLAVGLILGATVGLLWPQFGAELNPLAIGFVKLIRMVAGLIVFLTIVTGFAQMNRSSGLGRLGITTIVYFEVVSTLALVLGLSLGNCFQPGASLTIPSDGAASVSRFAESGRSLSTVDFLLNIIPKTAVDALSSGVMLQILLVSLLFGYALFALGERAKPVTDMLVVATDATFKVVGAILKLAPIGVFGAAAFTLGKFGLASLVPLAKLIGLVYLGCGLFFVVVFATVAYLTKFNLLKFMGHIKEEMIIAFTTTSSEAALPGLMRKLETAGCSKAVVGFVVPAGYSFNLDGSSIYMTLAALFIAQAAGLQLGWAEQVALLAVILLTSKGIAGVTGGAFVTLAASLVMFPDIPLAGLALILGVDRIMDAMRTVTNVVGNGVATMAIAYWHDQRTGPKHEIEDLDSVQAMELPERVLT